MALIETAHRFLPEDPAELAAIEAEKFPYINPEFIDRNRLDSRKPAEGGITYEFNETQLESGLLPRDIYEYMCIRNNSGVMMTKLI